MNQQNPAVPGRSGIRAAVVILAGGMGSRMGADVNKVYLTIRGREVLDYSVETTVACPMVTDIVFVHRPEDADKIESLVRSVDKSHPGLVVQTTVGGDTRHESEYAGVTALRSRIDGGHIDVVGVHDGARPFMGSDLLRRTVVSAATHGAVVPGLEITDALYALDRREFVDPGDHVWVQTPQAFAAATLLRAHDAAEVAGFRGVDTAEVVQRFSDVSVRVVAGHEANIKITFQTDLATSETHAAEWEAQHAGNRFGRA